MKMKARTSSETLVTTHKPTRRHNSEDHNRQSIFFDKIMFPSQTIEP